MYIYYIDIDRNAWIMSQYCTSVKNDITSIHKTHKAQSAPTLLFTHTNARLPALMSLRMPAYIYYIAHIWWQRNRTGKMSAENVSHSIYLFISSGENLFRMKILFELINRKLFILTMRVKWQFHLMVFRWEQKQMRECAEQVKKGKINASTFTIHDVCAVCRWKKCQHGIEQCVCSASLQLTYAH